MKSRLPIFIALLLLLCLSCGGVFLFLYNLGVRARSSVLRVTQTDPRLQDAAKVAQATLPKFLSRVAHPEAGDRFAVKVRFKTTVGPEYLWLKDPKAVPPGFSGTLDQNPIALEAKKGDRLSFKREDIFDWLVERKDGSRAGGFTDIALGEGRR